MSDTAGISGVPAGEDVNYIAVSALSHVGLVRDHNEDSVVIGPWTLCATVTQNPQTLLFPLGSPLIVAVADGLGGHPGGEVASTIVVRELAATSSHVDSVETVRKVLEACNRQVYAAAANRPELTTMGTTVAGVVALQDTVIAFNVGDSRIYEITPDAFRQISVDDSPPLAVGERSTVIVTQTLGGHPQHVEIDPHVSTTPLSPAASYLICTDGLSDLVPTETVGDTLRRYQDGRAAFELWKAAIEAGGWDNITLAIVRFGTEP